MGHNKFSLVSLMIFLIVGVVSVSACTADAINMPNAESPNPVEPSTLNMEGQAAQVIAQAVSDWQQVNSNGFGDPGTGDVTALEAFNGHLYAGTHNPIDPAPLFDGAQVFRSLDGSTWTPVTQPGFGNSHDIAPPAILDFVVFNNQLYASTGRGNASQIWRTSNGTIWAPMDVTGFSDPDNVDITALAVYNGKIYAGVTNQVTGAQIWSSFTGDNNSWTQVAPATPGTVPASVTGFAIFSFDGGLYAAIESEEGPVQIWRSYGSDWEKVVNDGFGDGNTLLSGGLTEFGGYLYVGAGNTAVGAQLWRTNDGATWEQAIIPGFGDPNNHQAEMVFTFQNQLYVGVQNALTGIEIWRTSDGSLWEQANTDGFGDSNNSTTNANNAVEDFMAQFYVGTMNVVDGGELWRTIQPAIVTDTPTLTATNTATSTSTNTPIQTLSFTPTNTATNTPTLTLTFTATNTPVDFLTDTPTYTPTNTLIYTLTYTPSFTPTFTATATSPVIWTSTATSVSTDAPTYTPTNTSTSTPTNIPTPTPTLLFNTPGKVTGGGNFDLSGGDATFGFVVKFDAKDETPSGNLTFIDHSANFKLKATSFELLVIDGNRAWFKGTGIIENGQVVKYEVEIEDSNKLDQPDTFYISMPALNGYGSGGALAGGNITIHK